MLWMVVPLPWFASAGLGLQGPGTLDSMLGTAAAGCAGWGQPAPASMIYSPAALSDSRRRCPLSAHSGRTGQNGCMRQNVMALRSIPQCRSFRSDLRPLHRDQLGGETGMERPCKNLCLEPANQSKRDFGHSVLDASSRLLVLWLVTMATINITLQLNNQQAALRHKSTRTIRETGKLAQNQVLIQITANAINFLSSLSKLSSRCWEYVQHQHHHQHPP